MIMVELNLSVCLSARLSVCLSVCLPVCLSVCQSTWRQRWRTTWLVSRRFGFCGIRRGRGLLGHASWGRRQQRVRSSPSSTPTVRPTSTGCPPYWVNILPILPVHTKYTPNTTSTHYICTKYYEHTLNIHKILPVHTKYTPNTTSTLSKYTPNTTSTH